MKAGSSARLELRLGNLEAGSTAPPLSVKSEPSAQFGLRPMRSFLRTSVLMLSGSLLLATVGCEPPATNRQPSGPITAASFEQVVSQDKVVLVKFGATWCAPCRSVDKELESLSGELPSDVEVLKVDVDDNPELARAFQITGIPRILLVRSGKILADKTGYMSKSEIQSWIGEHRTSEIQQNPFAQ